MAADQQRIVDLNVGGVLYTTSVETLTKVRQIIGWKEIKKIKYTLLWSEEFNGTLVCMIAELKIF